MYQAKRSFFKQTRLKPRVRQDDVGNHFFRHPHVDEDVLSESLIFEETANSQAHSTPPFSEDVSSESLIFDKRRHETNPPTSPFLEDVSGESVIFEDSKNSRQISTSPFLEDVSSESLIFDNARPTSITTDLIFWRISQAKRPF